MKQSKLRPSQGGRMHREVRPSQTLLDAIRGQPLEFVRDDPVREPAREIKKEFVEGVYRKIRVSSLHGTMGNAPSDPPPTSEEMQIARAADNMAREALSESLGIPSPHDLRRNRGPIVLTYLVDVPSRHSAQLAVPGCEDALAHLLGPWGDRMQTRGYGEADVRPAHSAFTRAHVDEYMDACEWPRRLVNVTIAGATSPRVLDSAHVFFDRHTPFGDTHYRAALSFARAGL